MVMHIYDLSEFEITTEFIKSPWLPIETGRYEKTENTYCAIQVN